jgi:RNA polymerase sigma-70 factor (ECF subfamily)
LTSGPPLETRYLDLIARNQGRIDRLCRAWSRTPTDRDDLRSEVLLQLWRSLPSFDGKASEDTWLYRVALNVAMLSVRRERSRRERVETWERTAAPPPPETAPPEQLERRERVERLMQAVAALAPGDRALVTLVLEDIPRARIAEIIGITENHVGVRVHRLKQKLARLMAEAQEVDHGRP